MSLLLRKYYLENYCDVQNFHLFVNLNREDLKFLSANLLLLFYQIENHRCQRYWPLEYFQLLVNQEYKVRFANLFFHLLFVLQEQQIKFVQNRIEHVLLRGHLCKKVDSFLKPLIAETQKRRAAGQPNLFNSHMFDKQVEAIDNKRRNKRYGASNIVVIFEK